ncbi:MAG: F0F1 ATP synthase subunit alpha, partial [Actinomycetota bacterium]|nr:F0F1 ATP synthase subunit alpha [Actinomycetota bacterium]
ELAQYRAMEAFAMFASDLDAASKQQLARGQRIMELFKQGQYAPFPVENQVVSIWAATTGKLDPVPVQDVSRFETEFLDFLKRSHGPVLDAIRETGKFEDDNEQALEAAYTEFLDQFETHEGESIRVNPGHEEFDALADEDVEQEQIVKQKRG